MLDFLEAAPEEWTPTCLAAELGMPRGTVSWVLSRLKRDGKVIYRKAGICNFYSASKRFSDEFTRLFKKLGTANRYQVHGLTLKLKGDFANAVPVGGEGRLGKVLGVRRVRGVLRWRFCYRGATVSFQLSRLTLMVWVRCSEDPLDYDGLLCLFSMVDGFLFAAGLPCVLGNMSRWSVVQYGFNRDWKRFRNDTPTSCVSVQGFMNWFARVYDKKSMGVLREEIHSREERSLEEFISLVDGSLTSVQVMNFLAVLSRNLNSLQKSNFELAGQVRGLTEKIETLTKKRRGKL